LPYFHVYNKPIFVSVTKVVKITTTFFYDNVLFE